MVTKTMSLGTVSQFQVNCNSRILRAAASLTAVGVAVKIAATLKEFTVAGIYGRSDAMDAFLVAFLIPNLLINLIAESMNQALLPTLIRVRIERGREQAQRLLSNSMFWMSVMLTAAIVIMALSAHLLFPVIGSNFAPAKLSLSQHLFYCLLPVVLLGGIASQCSAVLNTVDRFAVPGLAPMVMPVCMVAGALLLHGPFGIWALVYSTVFGALLHAFLMGWMMDRQAYRFSFSWRGIDDTTREVGRQYGPVLLSSVLASGGLIADQAMAAMLPSGSVSALVFAGRFVSVVVTLLAGAVSSALTPHLSTSVAHRDWQGCRKTLRDWSWLTAIVSIPLAVGLIAGSRLLVRITLQHGAFGPRDTALVASIIGMYAIQIPFFAVSRVHYRFLLAMRRSDLILGCGAVNLLLDLVLNLILMRWLGVAGIALATSLWSVSTLVFLWYWSTKLLSRSADGAGFRDSGMDTHSCGETTIGGLD